MILSTIDIVRDNLILNYETINTRSYDRVGTSIFDLTVNVHTGTLTNGPTFDTTNGSLIFDGTNDFIQVPNDGFITPPEISIELWVYPTNLTGTVYQNVWRIDNAGTPAQMIAFQNSGTILSFGLNTVTTGYAEMDHTINPVTYTNTWMHIVGTYTDGTKRLYINGQKVSESIANVAFYTENFTAPVGFTSTGDWLTDVGTIPSSNTYAGFSGGAYMIAANSNNLTETLTLDNSISTLAYTNVTVQWGGYIDPTFPPVTFSWSPNGTTWNAVAFTNVTNTTFSQQTNVISLPAGAAGLTNLRLRWQYTGNSGNVFYAIDDLVISGGTIGSGSTGIALFNNTNNLSIGTWLGSLIESFPGKIAVARLYKIALIPQEVLQNYNTNKNNFL